jgi:monoamine oxidase
VALPPTLAGRIRYSPALPPLRDQLTQQVPMGYVTKVQVAYPEPFWRAEGLSGSVFSLDDEVSVIFDNSPPDLRCGVLLGFLEGRHARRAGKLAPEERKELVLSVLARFFGLASPTPRSTSKRIGRPKSGAGAATEGALVPACGRATARRSGSLWAESTGRARRPPRSGMATWTGRCAPANAPPARCSSPKYHSAGTCGKAIRGMLHAEIFASFT